MINLDCEICGFQSHTVQSTDSVVPNSKEKYYTCHTCYSGDLVTKEELKEIKKYVSKYPEKLDGYAKYIESSEYFYSETKVKFNLNNVTFAEIKFKSLSDCAKSCITPKPIERIADKPPEIKKSPKGAYIYNAKNNDSVEVKNENMKINFIFNSSHTLEKCPKELSLEETFEHKSSCYFVFCVKESSEGEVIEIEFKSKLELKKININFINL